MKIKEFFQKLLFSGIILLIVNGCVSTKLPDNYNVKPEVLETHGGTVNVTVKGDWPEKSFHKKGAVKFTPVLIFENDTKKLKSFTLKGEKSQAEGTNINSKTGGEFSYQDSFGFNKDMKVSKLVAEAKIYKGGKVIKTDTVVLAKGVIFTSERIMHNENTIIAAHGYEKETIATENATLYYLINRDNVNLNIELNRNQAAKKARQDLIDFIEQGWEIKEIQIDAYASPEGEQSFNSNLSEDRGASARGFIEKKIMKFIDEPLEENIFNTSWHGEDWDGFIKNVRNSEIRQKDEILNIVNSQSDLKKREQEIRNMTVVFEELMDDILPPLRRSEIKVECFEPKLPDSKISELATTHPDSLKLEELLYAATMTDDNKTKLEIYIATIDLFPNDWKAYNNAAAIELNMGDINQAENHLKEAEKLTGSNSKIENNLGVVAARKGNFTDAESHFRKAENMGEDVDYNLGIIMITKGKYQEALQMFQGKNCNYNVALAQLMLDNAADAAQNLNCAPENAQTYYLLAIVGARTNKADMVYENLERAVRLNPKYSEIARNDREFLKFQDKPEFKDAIN